MNVFLYVLDTLADWEVSFLLPEINSGRYLRKDIVKPTIKKVGITLNTITTMGGLEITPDIDVASLKMNDGDIIILPGADTWQNGNNLSIIDFVSKNFNRNIVIAAICGGTIALADSGLLDNRRHTSNDKEVLKMFCKNYKGEKLYENKPVVIDNNLITATGITPLEFAYEVIKKLNVMKANTLEAWYKLYKTNDPKWFYELMETMKETA
jgi:putative intracellular protease/amidase